MPRAKQLPAKQQFVYAAMSRDTIAEVLNEGQSMRAGMDTEYKRLRFSPTDARLTDAVCQAYVGGIRELELQVLEDELLSAGDAYFEAEMDFQETFLDTHFRTAK